MTTEKEKTTRKRAALQVLEMELRNTGTVNPYWVETKFGNFDSRADALDAIAENGKAGVKYIIAEAEPKCIEEETKVRRKLV
jgi:hypothetical protein